MFIPPENSPTTQIGLAPSVLSQTSDDALPAAAGAFQLTAFYAGERSKLTRRQFTGPAPLQLHDPTYGEAAVAISDIAQLSLAYIRSTGHEVVVPEFRRPNLLVPVSGTLSSRNGHMHFKRASEPWVLFGRGRRETTVLPEKNAPYQAFVLSMPPGILGDRLNRAEARGGMIRGDASRDHDVHLAHLTFALATQLTISVDQNADMHLADAWMTVLTTQLIRCLDMCLGLKDPASPALTRDLSTRHVQKAEKLIYAKPDAIDSLRDIALHVGVSQRTLQAAFRAVRGATPMQVLAQARLDCARQALLDPKGPSTISRVCLMCGIEHHGRFSKLYKDAFGELPSITLKLRRNQ